MLQAYKEKHAKAEPPIMSFLVKLIGDIEVEKRVDHYHCDLELALQSVDDM